MTLNVISMRILVNNEFATQINEVIQILCSARREHKNEIAVRSPKQQRNHDTKATQHPATSSKEREFSISPRKYFTDLVRLTPLYKTLP